MKRVLFSLLLSVLIVSGCSLNDYKKLKFKSCGVASVTDVTYAKAAATACVTIDLGIENPTSSRFELLSLEGALYTEKGTKFADATAAQPVTLEPHSDGTIPLLLDATVYNPLALMFSSKVDVSDMTADVDVLVRMGRIEKRIKKEKLAVRDILRSAGDIKLNQN